MFPGDQFQPWRRDSHFQIYLSEYKYYTQSMYQFDIWVEMIKIIVEAHKSKQTQNCVLVAKYVWFGLVSPEDGLPHGLWFVSVEELKQAALFSIESRSFLLATLSWMSWLLNICWHMHMCPRCSLTGLRPPRGDVWDGLCPIFIHL